MPFVDLTLHHSKPTSEGLKAVREGLTRLMSDVLRKRADLTVVAITVESPSGIAMGGTPLEPGAWSGRLVAFVTAGTNSEGEKARFLAEAYRLLAQHLSPPASPFYIVVQEVPAGAWGYDGRSQAGRAQASVPVAA
ncbi:tautomerase family protein [Caenimonas aquaedulcis]|uniref:4-oxalocrotonate tautomerase n=1 Tax=Caenimonas aquaedulcis TaxID=2793270 RepID=A0A931MFU0_9BURK|nr:hypothetical protein [Caenimonas aquaedulcis]MBG9387631.1 4-oxalocrotonate tautomerase [Caenimonas aquaedulcis]